MKNTAPIILSLFFVIIFSACTVGGGGVGDKVGTSTMSGTITQAGGKYYLQLSSGDRQVLDSYSVELKDFLNKQVTVEGQFSGSELFVGKVVIE